jgi:multiple sugar transport system ATP-binding protein
MATVELEKLSKRFDGKNTVIHGIDLKVGDGEFVVCLGPSGCGKTTLLRMIAGLETITSGTVRVDGDVVNTQSSLSRDIALVTQEPTLQAQKTVAENMAFGLRQRMTVESEIRRRVGAAAESLRISHLLDRRPRELSGGQRQRVAIGHAIVRQPRVFLFDEPLANLDAPSRSEMRAEFRRLHERLGATIIYVTHDQTEAMMLADRMAVLSAGRVVQFASPSEIYNRPAALFVAGFTGAPPMNLADCRYHDGCFDIGGAPFAMPSVIAERAAGKGPVKFGIRPENITLARQNDRDVAVGAEVSLLEPIGSDTLVTLRVGSADLVARFPASFRQRRGERLTVHMNPEAMHLFKVDSGAAL